MTKEEPKRIKQGYQPSPSKNANVIPPNAGSHVRREKHIADLEKENAELKDKLKNLESVAEVRLANWQKYEKENKELKEQIEKMKCCQNCKFEDNDCIEEPCSACTRCLGNIKRKGNSDKWEIREK